jgi:serine/threonine protein kinase
MPAVPGVADPTHRLGSIVSGRYELGAVIGQGGTAVVYEARDLRLGNRVALKVILVRSPVVELRMQREARVAAALHHPNACLVTDVGKLDDGSPYLVMERLLGMSLATRLRSGDPLTVAEALEIGEQALSVLSVAHREGIVHRDIKPENLFLAAVPGRPALVKVLDFGVATNDSEDALTLRGHTVGTPAYMSPEQANGEPDIDGRSDIYSCAAVLFECLTGRRTFQAVSSRALLSKIAVETVPRIATLRADLPPWIAQAIDRALDVARDARYPTALDFLAALQGLERHTYDAWDYATDPLIGKLASAAPSVSSVSSVSSVPSVVPADEQFDDVTERIPSTATPERKGH